MSYNKHEVAAIIARTYADLSKVDGFHKEYIDTIKAELDLAVDRVHLYDEKLSEHISKSPGRMSAPIKHTVAGLTGKHQGELR